MVDLRKDLILQGLLRGDYEPEITWDDFFRKNAPDFGFNLLNRMGLLYKPIVDENRLAQGGKKAVWPAGKSFAVCLTHDVDAVSGYSLRENFRVRLAEIRESGSLRLALKNLLGACFDLIRFTHIPAHWLNNQDQLHCYERWLKIEASYGACSTFFFWPGYGSITKRHQTDCHYEMTDKVVFEGQKCTVAEMIKEIDRQGWEIGLHASWYSFDDSDELKRQKDQLERIVGHEIVSIRQHYLHYDIRKTPYAQAKAGFKYDSTLGFNDNVGFRFGTCYPWNLYDLQAQEALPLLEIPLIIQDGALLNSNKGLRLDVNTALTYVIQLSEEVERVGGVLTLLWHPNHIAKTEWWELYGKVLELLSLKQVWLTSVKNIGSWWEKCQGNS